MASISQPRHSIDTDCDDNLVIDESFWLIVEFKVKGHKVFSLINSIDLVEQLEYEKLNTGKVVSTYLKGELTRGPIVIIHHDKQFLETEIENYSQSGFSICTGDEVITGRKVESTESFVEEEEEEEEEYAMDDLESEYHPDTSDISDDDVNIVETKPSTAKFNCKNVRIIKNERIKNSNGKIGNTRVNKSSQFSRKKMNASSTKHIKSRQNNNLNITKESVRNVFSMIKDMLDTSGNRPLSNTTMFEKFKLVYDIAREINFSSETKDQETQTECKLLANQIDLAQQQKIIQNQMTGFRNMMNSIGARIHKLNRMESDNDTVSVERNCSTQAIEPEPKTSVLKESNNVNTDEVWNGVKKRLPNSVSTTESTPSITSNEDLSNTSSVEDNALNFVNNPVVRLVDKNTVAIGSGMTLISRYLYENLDWKNHTTCTRKLMMTLFSRKILATHSLTGKSSPAFLNKPAKGKLDTKKVLDIIMTVTANCRVPENMVRAVITTKCSDEHKMYRSRMAKKQNKKKSNRENQAPDAQVNNGDNKSLHDIRTGLRRNDK